MAMRTGGSVQPVTVAQAAWVEDTVLPVVFKTLQRNLEENNEASAFRVLNAVGTYLERLGELWEVEKAIAIAAEVAHVISPLAFSTEQGDDSSAGWHLGLVESLCLLPITTLLGFVKSLENAKLGAVRRLLDKVRWEKPETLYQAGFPRFVLPTLEWFRPRLDFEVTAEGRTITPHWLIEQGVVKDYLTALHEAVDLLFKANDRLYGAWHKRLVEAKRPC